MKKFLVFLILVGAGVSVWWFYDPYVKDYVEPLWEKIAGSPAEPAKAKPAPKPAEKPAEPGTTKPAAPQTASTKPAPPRPETAPKPQAPPEPPKSEVDRIVEEQYPFPKLQPLMEIVDNWNNVPPRAFPEQVTTKDRIGFKISGPDGRIIGSSVVVPGNLVAPVRLEGQTLVIANLGNPAMKSQIHIDKTDFKQRIEKRYADFSVTMRQRITALREKARKELLAKPEQFAAFKAGGGWDDEGDPRLAPVKASLAANQVKAFNLDEAVGFRWNGQQRIDGDRWKGTYDTVTVKYEARTIFGVFPGEALCLLEKGKVVGWVDPITMEERI